MTSLALSVDGNKNRIKVNHLTQQNVYYAEQLSSVQERLQVIARVKGASDDDYDIATDDSDFVKALTDMEGELETAMKSNESQLTMLEPLSKSQLEAAKADQQKNIPMHISGGS
jgi:uncharacterized protein (DUF2345 family)